MKDLKKEVFTVKYDEELKSWVATGTSFVFPALFYDKDLDDEDKEAAPALALFDLMGYDSKIIAEELDILK